jgi:ubiquinone/menaquinone biosynthesis C-methylase UbiE
MEQISRVVRSKDKAKASYDKMSRWYDLLVGKSEKKFRDKGLELLDVQEGETVLEIGFGTGHCTQALARSVGPTGHVYGIDISEGMLNITASRIKDAGLSERVFLQLGDAVNLPFQDNFFDAVFMSFTLELFDTPEIPAVLDQCQQVLKDGGRICVVSMSKEDTPGLMLRLYEWGHEKLPNYIDCRPIFLKTFLENAGFQIQKKYTIRLWGLPVEIVLADKPSFFEIRTIS